MNTIVSRSIALLRALSLIAIVVSLACVLRAQTPVVPAGLVYQAAAQSGIAYIEPAAGQAIVNQKAALNWHSIVGSALSDGSIGILTGGLAGVIHLSKVMELSLASFHAYYDHTVAPILAEGAPSPNSIAPVLAMTGMLAPSPTACAEASMYAVYSKGSSHGAGPVTINGVTITYTPQGIAVLKNISGQRIKSVEVIDVLACVPGNIVLPIVPPNAKKAAWIPEADLYALALPQ